MGRVYKALVRAERWSDRERPIGAPSNDADLIQGGGIDFSAGTDFATHKPFEITEDEFYSSTSYGLAAAVSAEEVLGAGKLGSLPAAALDAVIKPIPFEEPEEILDVSNLTIDPHLAALTGDDSLAAERINTLSARILNIVLRRKLKTLLVTSAEGGEGKSSVATNVAWSLAKQSKGRVLLIDAAPKSSPVCRFLGLKEKRGWIDLVDRSCASKQAIVRLNPNGLYVLSAGRAADTATPGACEARLEDVIADIKSRFEIVIVDSSAILGSLETQSLAASMDGAVIVARAGYTNHAKVTAATKLVPKERRLGVVLNEADVERGHGTAAFASQGKFGRKRRRA
jgi:protein-tyrosine kinase